MLFHCLVSEKMALKFCAFFLFLPFFNKKAIITCRQTLLDRKSTSQHKNLENFTFWGIYNEFLKNLPKFLSARFPILFDLKL